jgi:hypothetical protein
MSRLIHEVHRYYRDEKTRRFHRDLATWDRRRNCPHRPLTRTFDTPLKMLLLVGTGAALSPLVPSLMFLLLQGATLMAVGLVVWWCWRLFQR